MTNIHYDAAQLAAVRSGAPRTLVLSAAGSGKTAMIVGHVRHLLDTGVQPGRVVCLTYTTAAAKVMSDRMGAKISFVGTLHSFLLRLLNSHGALVGFAPGVSAVDDEWSADMVAEIRASQRYKGTEAAMEQALREWPGSLACPTPAQLVVMAYRRKLRQSNATDFGGIVHWGLKLVQKMAADGVWKVTHLVVDEFQDTSAEFAAVYDAMPVAHRFYCGDPNQSIFSFLGGDVGNILSGAAAQVVVRAETSYRCPVSVCRAATALVAAGGGVEKTMPRPGAPEGRCECREFADMEAEVKWIAKTVRELECEDDCAVLLRTNSLKELYAAALEGYGIPVARREQPQSPQDWRVVRSLLAALQNVDNDLVCESFLVALRGKEAAAESKREAVAAGKSLNAHCLHMPVGLNARAAAEFCAAKRPSQASCERLAAALALLPEDAPVSDLLVALNEPEKADIVAGGVVVSTVHSAKGLEFSTVMLPAFEEGVLPSARDARDPASLAEARRVAYVAITRAEQNLFVSHCRVRRERFGRFADAEMQVSRFVREAGLGDVA